MPPFDSPHDADCLIVYGLGTVGQAIVDDLLAEGINIELILDRGKGGESYRNIPILAIEDAGDDRLTGKTVLVGLHNHYVDINILHANLLAAGRSEEHPSELQSLMRISYDILCLKKTTNKK